MEKHIHCPVNGFDCPYYKNTICTLKNPFEECDDFASMWDKDDNYWCEGDTNCALNERRV